ncbi:hypothetical protein GYA19_04020 [Candidatus Beckwithbacteria bacterium]|nr:hypothetical protein [Candidatus Beckwithbacteria bacterium]
MHYLIHGDYHLQSRKFLTDLKQKAKTENKEIIELNGQILDLNQLIQATTSNSLFGAEKLIVIENLFSRLKSQAQEEILAWLKNYKGENPIIFWEKKGIGKILQRKLPDKTLVKEFKTPVIIFKLVEILSPKNKKQALETLNQALVKEPAEFIFVMLARQMRILLMLKGNQKITGAPWMIGKYKQQASFFETEKLMALYQDLYKIDKQIKTGKTIMPLDWHLQIWMAGI